MAMDLLLDLVEAGAALWLDGDRVCFRAPVGVVGEEARTRAAACRAALRALLASGAVLPADRAAWPEDALDAFEERAAIMEFDGGLLREVAEREAERRVRVDHTRAFVQAHAFVATPDAVAVATGSSGDDPHRRP